MGREQATGSEEKAPEAPVEGAPKPAPRSMGARSLKGMAWGAGLAVVACVGGYIGGGIGTTLFAFALALVVALVAGLVLIIILVRSFAGHPGARQAAPGFLGMATFSAVALFGSLFVVPRIYERHVETLKGAAVEAIESHRLRTGLYPASDDAPAGLPEEVGYGRPVDEDGIEDEGAYWLHIENGTTWFAHWRYDSRTKEWKYRSD